jgi:Cupin domain
MAEMGEALGVIAMDAFKVLEGELTFEIGREAETVTVSSGGFVAVPPQVAHSFRNHNDRCARWLTIHARDGGFAAFRRGVRDGVEVEWDISVVPAGGGLPASEAIVSPEAGGEYLESRTGRCRLRCALPDTCVAEWHPRGPHPELPLHDQDREIDSFFVIEGELGSVPRDVQHTFSWRGLDGARVLSLHTPGVATTP